MSLPLKIHILTGYEPAIAQPSTLNTNTEKRPPIEYASEVKSPAVLVACAGVLAVLQEARYRMIIMHYAKRVH